jgi:hypothetical protein
MTHQHVPSFTLARPNPTPPDPTALERAVSKVGVAFPAIGALLVEGWVAS